VTAVSSDHGVVLDGGVVMGGSGASRTVAVTPVADANGPTTITLTVSDGDSLTSTMSFTVEVTAVNDSVVTTDGTLTTDEDTAGSGILVGTDIDGDDLTYTIATDPTHGDVVLDDATTGDYTYTPDADYNGSDSFTFTVNDGTGDSAPATITVTVNPINDAPVGTAQGPWTIDEDTTLTGTVAGTDTEDDPLTYSPVSTTTDHGTIAIESDGDFVYTPGANFNGTDTFQFVANDGTADSAPVTVTVTVTPVNDLPTIDWVARQYIGIGGTTGALEFKVGDEETDGSDLTITATSSSQGIVPDGNIIIGGSGTDRTITVVAVPILTGQTTITIRVTDGEGEFMDSEFVVDVGINLPQG
jgi:VCBS repeat-containing protein